MQRSTINYEDSQKNVRNLHVFKQQKKKTKKRKQYFCTLWTCNFSMFLLPFFSLADMKWPVLQLHRRREHTAWWQIFNYFLLGVDHLIFYVARYFFLLFQPCRIFLRQCWIHFSFLRVVQDIFFLTRSICLIFLGGFVQPPLSKNKWSTLISKYQIPRF